MAAEGQGLIYKNIYPLTMVPGILRDGTQFSRPNWIDGQWVRFYRGLPRKMGGYEQIFSIPAAVSNPSSPFFGPLSTVSRGLYVVPLSPDFNVYLGNANGVGYIPVDFFGNPTGSFNDRTPVGFAGDNNNAWQFDVMFSGLPGDDTSILIAFAAPNLAAVDSAIQRPVYYGTTAGTSANKLIPTGFNVSGGIVVLSPYLFMLDNDGLVIISNPSDPTTELDSFRIAPYKLVAGLPVRGGNTSPAGLIWSLDRLIRVTQVGTSTGPEWNFDTVSADVSVMSATCMIEFDSQYFWMGIDRFYNYNGVVTELPNNMNWEFLFDNLNYAQRSKVWVTKVTAWGEIWWFYPEGNSVECNRAIVYNVREKTWYDTDINRSCGYYASTFAQPIWADNAVSYERQLNGTASSSSGIAANAFDGSGFTACTQTAANGNISYQWATTPAIVNFQIAEVGVTSFTTQNYTLSFQHSTDGASWTTVLAVPIQSYPALQTVFFTIPAYPAANYFRILETGGGTLNINQLYFNVGVYHAWLQEQGTDQDINGTLTPILSSITSGTLSWIGVDPNKQRRGMDRWMSMYRVEPDFVQSGAMTMTINFQDYPQSTNTYQSGPYTFQPDTVKIDIDTPRQGREVTITFESNVVGGDYEMGETLIVATVGDGRQSVPGS